MYSIVYVYTVNPSKKIKKCIRLTCLNCDISLKYVRSKNMKTCSRTDFNINQTYREKGKFNFMFFDYFLFYNNIKY